jgi:DNA topoisomerase I
MKTLLIVESPAKSKTIEKLLGPGYIVLSSFGHIRNLDKDSLGIDVENDFKPNYCILSDRNKQIKAIKDTIKTVDKVLLAADEDREGEAIAWHCAVVFKLDINTLNRICFHEITKSALEHAVANPRKINMQMVYSQQARRILDRLVGFKLSPLLWKHILPKLSAGRVQSSALKVLIDQEKEINNHTEKKFYKTIGQFSKISAILNTNFENQDDTNKFLNDCKTSIFKVLNIDKKIVERRPPPPYITSTIQQDIGSRFGISSKQTMSILQKLYENGVITYHRTDSTNLSTQIQDEIKKYILDTHGKIYLHARIYKSKIKCAQEAHEAIRPTHIDKENLDDTFDAISKKVYDIIWKRTVASQMSASKSELCTVTINISNRKELFISKVEKIIFDGYKKIYEDIKEDKEEDDNILTINDNIQENDILEYIKITSTEKNKTPPSRYTEASLIKQMEKIGIGRPSTYSNIIETIIERKYVEKKDIKGIKIDINILILEKNNIKNKKENIIFGAEKKKIVPTDLGKSVTEFLETHFSHVLEPTFTSTLEQDLDEIANGRIEWLHTVKSFYDIFIVNVNKLNSCAIVNNDNKRLIGQNEEGNNVYAYIGKYGPVLQTGDKDVKYVKLDAKYNVETVSIKDYNEITKFPKNIGKYKAIDILIKKGMYGFYISYDNKNYKLLENMDENILLEDAIKCIDGTNNDKKIDKYTIKNGQYGYYILYNKKFYSIPKDYDIEKLTKDACDIIVKLPKKVYKK